MSAKHTDKLRDVAVILASEGKTVLGDTIDNAVDAIEREHAELVACCERALNQSARVHPDFLEQLQAALAKARGES